MSSNLENTSTLAALLYVMWMFDFLVKLGHILYKYIMCGLGCRQRCTIQYLQVMKCGECACTDRCSELIGSYKTFPWYHISIKGIHDMTYHLIKILTDPLQYIYPMDIFYKTSRWVDLTKSINLYILRIPQRCFILYKYSFFIWNRAIDSLKRCVWSSMDIIGVSKLIKVFILSHLSCYSRV